MRYGQHKTIDGRKLSYRRSSMTRIEWWDVDAKQVVYTPRNAVPDRIVKLAMRNRHEVDATDEQRRLAVMVGLPLRDVVRLI